MVYQEAVRGNNVVKLQVTTPTSPCALTLLCMDLGNATAAAALADVAKAEATKQRRIEQASAAALLEIEGKLDEAAAAASASAAAAEEAQFVLTRIDEWIAFHVPSRFSAELQVRACACARR